MNKLIEGMREAVAFAEGKIPALVREYEVTPATKTRPARVKLRMKAWRGGASAKIFTAGNHPT